MEIIPHIWVWYGLVTVFGKKNVMVKINDQKRTVKKNCPYGFPGAHKG